MGAFGGQTLTANIVTMSRARRHRDVHPQHGEPVQAAPHASRLARPFRAPFYPVFPAIALGAAVVCLAAMVYYNLLIAGLFVALGALGCVYFALTPKLQERAAMRSDPRLPEQP